ncbi:hypothetical protein CPT_Sansa122 [Caulobacter phage Sansa]|uniref:Uncharacterized protein n=1 Tax=Caulobacter phage Sansa TaxID=1675600 RepID=A0A0K1LLZ6_9CAUD|nr:hypothetical protein HOR07_gp007 [Caulobacter phage Sansa]YP_009785510.1 hypothetical protein HOR07_gp122 [Caulobacter phage Sansa]AKU43411.1 hypothetical protein CPT_Sansa7 [Caulobacter phage Sansa]AKU43526.1 hypothetical protein CPT_Sansa122 [Caulobacter phage Sansa]
MALIARILRQRTPAHLARIVRPQHHRMACVLYSVDPHTGGARFELAGRGEAGQLVRATGSHVTYGTEADGVRVQWTLGLIPVNVSHGGAMVPTLARA